MNLIGTRKPGKLDEKTRKKIEKEEDAIREAAKEMEKRERTEAKREDKQAGSSSARQVPFEVYWQNSVVTSCIVRSPILFPLSFGQLDMHLSH